MCFPELQLKEELDLLAGFCFFMHSNVTRSSPQTQPTAHARRKTTKRTRTVDEGWQNRVNARPPSHLSFLQSHLASHQRSITAQMRNWQQLQLRQKYSEPLAFIRNNPSEWCGVNNDLLSLAPASIFHSKWWSPKHKGCRCIHISLENNAM